MSSTTTVSFESFFTADNTAPWSDPQLWRDKLEELTITDNDAVGEDTKATAAVDNSDSSKFRERLIEDGYALVDDIETDKSFAVLTEKLKQGIQKLHDNLIPASCILLFDECWEYAQHANKVLQQSTHSSNVFNYDMLAWHIDPKEDVAGFSPHRDRQPEGDTASSFHDNDDQAKYVTMWIALSDATPENSCLYVIPKKYDPGYLKGDDDDDDPLRRALATKESYQHIRALPRSASQAVLFTHRILHWGSRGNPKTSKEPRIALSFVCSDAAFEQPYVGSSYFTPDAIPPFRIRLLLVCAQLLIYYQRFDLPKSCLRACYEYCKQHESELDPTYRGKVGVEFVKAMKEATTAADDDDDEEDEAMLEEMLQAEEKGYGEFQDDFDEADAVATSGNDFDEHDEFDDEEEASENALFGAKRKANGDAAGVAKMPRK